MKNDRSIASTIHDTKFMLDVIWNFGSLGVIAVAGLALNIIVARYYGAAVVGVFGIVLAVFAIAGQAAIGGFGFALLHYLPKYGEQVETRQKIFATALGFTTALSATVALSLWAASGWIGRILDSPQTGFGIALVAPAVFLFALNKCLLFALNARRRMRLFAVGQALRVIIYVLALGVFVASGVGGEFVPLVLTIGEAGLLLFLIPLMRRDLAMSPRLFDYEWTWRMTRFGRDGFLIGLLADINVKVDVIMLGYFLSEGEVGLYVFMAMFAEGLGQVPVVIQNNLNPLIARLAHDGELARLRDYLIRMHLYFVPFMLVATVVGSAMLPLVSDILTGDPAFGTAWPVFAILGAGIVVTAGVTPLIMALTQIGRPGLQAALFAVMIVTNIVFNLALIPAYGLYGAATATALVTILSAMLLLVMMRSVTGRWMWSARG